MGSRSATPPTEPASPLDGGVRKRVCKACDRCRLKKSKCDGAGPCSRCKADNAICVFGERKKSHDKVYPKGYVEMLETQQAQLVSGLQELYKRIQSGEGWPGAPLKESKKGAPLTHEILERLGALKQDGHTDDYFEENLDILQRKLLADGASFTRGMSFDTGSDIDQSPIFEPLPHPKASHFSNPWTMSHLPPTPPTNSPRPSLVKTSSPLKSEIPTPISQMSEESPIFMEPSELPEVMDFNMSFQAPMDFSNMQAMQGFYDPTRMIINPCLTMKDDWYQHDNHMAQYFNGGTFP